MTVERSVVRWRSRFSEEVETRPPAAGESPKAKTARRPAEPTGRPSTVAPSAARQSSSERDAAVVGDASQVVGERRVAGLVDGQHGSRAGPYEAVGVGGFEERPVGGFDVGEDRASAGQDDEIGGRRRRHGRQDDLAAVADVDGKQRQMERRRAAGDRHDAPLQVASAACCSRTAAVPWVSQPDLSAPAVRSALSRSAPRSCRRALAGRPLVREPDHVVVARFHVLAPRLWCRRRRTLVVPVLARNSHASQACSVRGRRDGGRASRRDGAAGGGPAMPARRPARIVERCQMTIVARVRANR